MSRTLWIDWNGSGLGARLSGTAEIWAPTGTGVHAGPDGRTEDLFDDDVLTRLCTEGGKPSKLVVAWKNSGGVEETLGAIFRLSRALYRPLMRMKGCSVWFVETTGENDSMEASILSEGVGALSTVMAMELARKGVVVNSVRTDNPESMVSWLGLGGEGSGLYLTAQRIVGGVP